MNREERRKNGNKDKPKTYTLTDEQLKAIVDDAIDEASNKAFGMMLGLPLIVLRDTFGFGKERLTRFMDGLLYQYDSFDKDYIALEDLTKTIEEETGYKVTWNKKPKGV